MLDDLELPGDAILYRIISNTYQFAARRGIEKVRRRAKPKLVMEDSE
ncbi:hypothetical protein BN873_p20051 [Candidatus Competibacter denitrificans Run_A_D11]|uniref:Uncharacterized protein n=1 Tax=Candidatus Competibacter denitrificans Run_A_D11 TaxID=1400863 RepID=W6M9G8_9GAMM|nr:hypothetical protein BN873_p20051 [Candidatus Competibacter denitrificans Run_A_D11]